MTTPPAKPPVELSSGKLMVALSLAEEQGLLSPEETEAYSELLASAKHGPAKPELPPEPEEPDFFLNDEELKPFKPLWILPSDKEFTLAKGIKGFEKTLPVRKFNLSDMLLCGNRLPHYGNYLGYSLPEFLVDQKTKRYRIPQVINIIIMRAFGDYNSKKRLPRRFALSVLDTISQLLTTEEHTISIEFLLSCDPNEVIEACQKVYEVNEAFFSQKLKELGPILKVKSMLGGLISENIKPLLMELSSKFKALLSRLETSGGVPNGGGKTSLIQFPNAMAEDSKQP